MLNVRTTADFLAEPVVLHVTSYGIHFYLFAVFACKKCTGTFCLGFFKRLYFHCYRQIFLDFFVYNVLDLLDFFLCHRTVKRKVKTHTFVIYVRTFLCNLITEYIYKCLLQQVGSRMIFCSYIALFCKTAFCLSCISRF